MASSSIEFRRITISKKYGDVIYNIYYVVDNNRSPVIENFAKLESNVKDDIKDLISKMATVNEYKSPKIKYNLKGYNYGEIKPVPHRFFFFQKCGNNFIFFDYIQKKKASLGNTFYKNLERKKEKYAKEFKKYINSN